jgi:hypothetical protein
VDIGGAHVPSLSGSSPGDDAVAGIGIARGVHREPGYDTSRRIDSHVLAISARAWSKARSVSPDSPPSDVIDR